MIVCFFNVRPSDFCNLFKVRHVMGALIMTAIEYTEKSFIVGIEPGPSRTGVVCFNHSTIFLRPTIRLFTVVFKVRHVMGALCINHDIVVGLWSQLLIRLSYCIHRIYGLEYGYSKHSTKALTFLLTLCTFLCLH